MWFESRVVRHRAGFGAGFRAGSIISAGGHVDRPAAAARAGVMLVSDWVGLVGLFGFYLCVSVDVCRDLLLLLLLRLCLSRCLYLHLYLYLYLDLYLFLSVSVSACRLSFVSFECQMIVMELPVEEEIFKDLLWICCRYAHEKKNHESIVCPRASFIKWMPLFPPPPCVQQSQDRRGQRSGCHDASSGLRAVAGALRHLHGRRG